MGFRKGFSYPEWGGGGGYKRFLDSLNAGARSYSHAKGGGIKPLKGVLKAFLLCLKKGYDSVVDQGFLIIHKTAHAKY